MRTGRNKGKPVAGLIIAAAIHLMMLSYLVSVGTPLGGPYCPLPMYSILNKESKTHRHNLVNKAVYNAVNAQATTSVILGDKGDGAKRDRAEALKRYAHYNKDHVPDIIEQGAAKNGKAVLYEIKCYSQLATMVSLGKGTAGTGGKPSTAMGHSVGFGCTEEILLYMTLGCIGRGDPSQGAFSHDTGEGWVQAKKGHYHDAIYNKHNAVKGHE